jgi:hypothetical protein
MIRRVILALGNYQDIIILYHPTDKILITGHKSTTFRYRWQNLLAAASNIGTPVHPWPTTTSSLSLLASIRATPGL